MKTEWLFGRRKLKVLGVQGLVEYAQDHNSYLWYRFLDDDPAVRDSWKLVAT